MKMRKSKMRKCTAALLAFLLACTCTVPSFAADGAGKPYSPIAHAIDNVLGLVHDGVFRSMQKIFSQKDIPKADTFQRTEQPQFYPGTNGTSRGSGWSAGFASGSVIPAAWRCDPNGKSDPNGWCIKPGKRATGGYQNKAGKILCDQRLNLFILSNGADGNGNGIADVMLFVSVDGVGMTTGTVNKMRAAIEEALAPSGVTHDDILACNISATHCHNGLDTEGISIGSILAGLPRCLVKIPTRSLDTEMENTLAAQASACAKTAYGKMEPGTLSFFETDSVNGSGDRLNDGVKLKDWFSCFLFTSRSGEKTILSNLAKHPVSYWKNYGALFTDFPYYMGLAMQDAGYNFLFTQSAQATIYGGSDPREDERAEAAEAWVQKYHLTYEDWVERYGAVYAKLNYDRGSKFGQQDLENFMKSGYCLAQFVLDYAGKAKSVEPTVRIRNMQTMLKLDNGLLALGAITGLLGENVVRTDASESRCGIMVETNYMEIGSDIVILTAPGEFSPALLFGSDPNAQNIGWTGANSWTGEDWKYDTLENIVRKTTGDSDKTVLLFGLTNDAIGYVYPDTCVTESIIGAAFYDDDSRNSMVNNMMLTTGTTSASQFMESYTVLIEEAATRTE